MHQEGQSKSKPETGVEGSDGKDDKIIEMTHREGLSREEEDELTEDSHLVELRKSICNGDWSAVGPFFPPGGHLLDTVILSNEGYTALHVAILAGKYEIVEELIKMMSETDLEKKTAGDSGGHTALTLVATTGKTNMAKCIVEKNSNLLAIENDEHFIPVTAACAMGHKDMTRYLYSITPAEVFLRGKYGFDLVRAGMENKMFGNRMIELFYFI